MADAGNSGQPDAGDSPVAAAPQRWTVRSLLGWIIPYLKDREVDSPRTIAEILLAEVLQVERLRLYMEPERELAPDELAALRSLVARAGRHEPVQFLVGKWPFLGRDFEVAPCTLIPRPCTETLVEHALQWYRERGAGPVRALDLCTGSGCIAVSLALGMRAILRPDGVGCRPISADPSQVGEGVAARRPPERVIDASGEERRAAEESRPAAAAAASRIEVVATDLVSDAVALARRNAARHGVEIELRAGDLWQAVRSEERFDLIVSNPPYVTDDEYAALDRNVKEYEPASALRGGVDGLDVVRRVVAGAQRHLLPEGMLAIEIGWKHRDAALGLIDGPAWRGGTVHKDGDGIDRVLVAIRTEARG
ncbi:MAG: peptide chain release factor N(5)-glutamine methyltransferase [bacterium]